MLRKVSWKCRLSAGLLGFSLLTISVRAQLQDSNTAPSTGADARSYVQFGIANGAKGDLSGAIAAFDEAIQIDPKYAPAYYNRAYAYTLERNDASAMADYDKVIQIDPTYKAAYYQRGSLKGKQGDFDAAISDFNETVKLDPKYAPAYYNLGHVYYFKGDLDNAFKEINVALSLQPDFALGYFIRGLIRRAQDHKEESTADFQKSLGLNFPYGAFWIWIAEEEGGHHGLALQNLTTALNKSDTFRPDDWPTQIGNFLLGKITEDQFVAQASQGEPSETNDRICEAWFYIGFIKHLGGDDKGAKDCFNKAIATDSKGSEEYVEANRELSR